MALKNLRTQLTDIDRRILDLVAERQSVVERIGELKRAEGRATRDFGREKRVIEDARQQAGKLGIPPPLAQGLMQLLIRSSLTRQERARVRAEGHGHGQRALVIGGSGQMGQWFAGFLDSQGFDVTVADPAVGTGEFQHYADWRQTPDDFELTVIATPIGVTADILLQIAETGRKGLVFDVGSLKAPLERGLRQMAAKGVRVTSLHPMFGPDTELLSGRHVLFLEVGVPEATQQAQQLFASTMAQRIEMPLEDHDRLIAYVLGLSHALNIAFFTALAGSGETVPKLAELSSTTFDAQLGVAAKVAEENPHLYFEIQAQNPHGLAPLRDLAEAVERIAEVVRTGDEDAFVELMQQGREYFARRR
jgi:chorismate mutase/prephenate dehydrogenase